MTNPREIGKAVLSNTIILVMMFNSFFKIVAAYMQNQVFLKNLQNTSYVDRDFD